MYDAYTTTGQAPMYATESSTPMMNELKDMDAALDKLGKSSEILEQRLQPVLFSSEPPSMSSPGAPRETTFPLGQEIRERTARIMILTERIITLHERIGV